MDVTNFSKRATLKGSLNITKITSYIDKWEIFKYKVKRKHLYGKKGVGAPNELLCGLFVV